MVLPVRREELPRLGRFLPPADVEADADDDEADEAADDEADAESDEAVTDAAALFFPPPSLPLLPSSAPFAADAADSLSFLLPPDEDAEEDDHNRSLTLPLTPFHNRQTPSNTALGTTSLSS